MKPILLLTLLAVPWSALAVQMTQNPVAVTNTASAKVYRVTCCLDLTEDGCDTVGTTFTRCIDDQWTKPMSCEGYSNVKAFLSVNLIADNNGASTDFVIYECEKPFTGDLTTDPATNAYCRNWTTAFGTGPLTSGDADAVPPRNQTINVTQGSFGYFVGRVTCTTGCDESALYIRCADSQN